MTNVTCGLTAKKLGSALCPTLIIEYGTALLFENLRINDKMTTYTQVSFGNIMRSESQQQQTHSVHRSNKIYTYTHLWVVHFQLKGNLVSLTFPEYWTPGYQSSSSLLHWHSSEIVLYCWCESDSVDCFVIGSVVCSGRFDQFHLYLCEQILLW